MEVARCQSEESLGQLVTNFTTTFSRFGSLETVELERGGHMRRVTLRNRDIFIHKFCHWHLIGIYIPPTTSLRIASLLCAAQKVSCLKRLVIVASAHSFASDYQ